MTKDAEVQCSINTKKYLKDAEKKLKQSKKFFEREMKEVKKTMEEAKNEKSFFLIEEKKNLAKIKVIIDT